MPADTPPQVAPVSEAAHLTGTDALEFLGLRYRDGHTIDLGMS